MTVKVTPLNQSDVVELSQGSNLFEKQILPWGSFNYKGNVYTITEDWADKAIKAFEDRAFDQTPFALADEYNSHDVDHRPDRFGGEVLRFIKRPTGFNAILRLTNKAAETVRNNKKLGVSVRFRENYQRDADQRSWPVVIDQVLGTLKPRLTGMTPWKEVMLSNLDDGTLVEDSSNGVWEMTKPVTGEKDNDNSGAPKNTDENPGNSGTEKDNEKVTLNAAEYAAFKRLIGSSEGGAGNGSSGNNVTSITDINDDDALIDSLLSDDKKEKEPVGLSEDRKRIIALSNEVARSNFERDAQAWKLAGVPPAIIELAAPVLSSYDEIDVVTLSDDGTSKTIDARTVVRAILDECKGTVALADEEGHANRGVQQDEEFTKAYQAFLSDVNQF